jgi:hypothetical protein
MIGVFVTFSYRDKFDEQAVRDIAETARSRFEGMPGLRSKAFTVNPGKREARNFYVWDSEDTARAFFSDALLEHVTSLYGVRPSVEFVHIATVVENTRAEFVAASQSVLRSKPIIGDRRDPSPA